MGDEAAWLEDDGPALDGRWQPSLVGEDDEILGFGPDGEAPASLESLDQILNCIADPIFVKDRRHRLVLVNDAECALAGRQRAELLGRTDRDILTSEQRDLFWEQDDRVIETGEEIISEDEIPDARGVVRTFVTRKTRFIDAAGSRFVVGVIRDISARKRAERELRDEKAFSDTVTDSLPGIFYVLDEQGRFMRWNRAEEEFTGIPPEELMHRVALLTLHPDDRAQAAASMRQALECGHGEAEARAVRKDGAVRHFLLTGRRIDIEGARYVVGTGIDITERKLAEAQLLGLAAAVEQSADDIVITDLDGTIRYVNAAFERTTGYSRAEAVGRPVGELLSARIEDPVHDEVFRTLRDGHPWQGRLTNRTRDGRPILQDASISAIRDASGAIVAFVSAQRDVTAQTEMEARAARAEKLEAIGTLAGGVAHDFNNILSAIVGNTQIALLKSPRDAAVRGHLDAVLQGARRATDLVRQILAFSRQETREEKAVRVSLIVKEALQFLRATIPSTIEIRKRCESDAAVLADPTEIHRIAVNLCTNAALAMREQGGLLEVTLEDVDLDASFAARHPGVVPGRFVRLVVRDTGCGIPAEIQGRIFEPFFTTRGQGFGTGMGLAVVHGIVARCHGTIVLESAPGKGSAFQVYLPVYEEDAPEVPAGDEPVLHGSERVLFVDDDPLVADVTTRMLCELGYQVRAYTSSVEATAAFEADPRGFDIVITDMTMPGMTGDMVARRVKSVRPDVRVVLCTGYSERISAETAPTMGIDEFLMKPVPLAQLSKVLRRLLARS